MKKIFGYLLFFFLTINAGFSQDKEYFRETIRTLSSPEFHGRGYAFKGDSIAAQFLAGEMKKMRLKSWEKNYFQRFTIDRNIFEGKTDIDFGKNYAPAELFDNVQFFPYSGTIKGRFKTVLLQPEDICDKEEIFTKKLRNKIVAVDLSDLDGKDSLQKKLYDAILQNAKENVLQSAGYLLITEKLTTWRLAEGDERKEHVVINAKKDYLSSIPEKIAINLESRFIENYQMQNVCSYVEGKKYPDSLFVLVAHYDHLGQFGKDYIFPGAHDNASGTALVLSLAQYFSQPEHQPDCSVAFILTTGEEIGLLGSRYFVENSYFPISNIKFVINFDMVGSGEDGIMIVGGKTFPEMFDKFMSINEKHHFLEKIGAREISNNSDHYPFYEKGATAFFIYTKGKSGKYHHKSDTLENISLTGFEGLFRLVVECVNY